MWVAAALFLAAGAAHAQDYGHQAPWDDDANSGGQVFQRGNQQSGPIRIRTSRPACLLSAGFPVVRALVEPSDTVAAVTLHFRPEGYPLWYQLPMKRSGEGFLAMMPKPRPSAQRVLFFVEVKTLDARPLRGNELSARVVEDPAQCEGPPAETAERAAIAVRVPKGAPAVPPVPPGFEPVGTVSLEPFHQGSGGKTVLYVAGGFAAALGGIFASGDPRPSPMPSTTPNQIEFVDSVPPPDSHLSLSSGAQLNVRLRVRINSGLSAAGLVRVTLLSTFSPAVPCAVIEVPIGSALPPNFTQEVLVSGPFSQARVCQPAHSLRLEIVLNGTVVAGTGMGGGQPDVPARYFIDP